MAAIVVSISLIVGAGYGVWQASHRAQGPRISYSEGGKTGSRPIDWSMPLPFGVPEQSVEAAQRELPFTVIEPKGLGNASAIFVDDPQKVELDKRVLVFVFQDPSLGQFWVVEHASSASVSDLKASVEACHNAPVCIGNPQLITLSDGSPAVLVTNDEANVTRVTWLRNGIELVVMGPMDRFSVDHAIAAANGV